jgi:hypothetical protein
MKLNISHLGSNDWFNYKSEIIYGLFHAFSKLGHDVTILHNNFSTDRHNILIGADWLANEKNTQALIQTKIDYSIFEVEAFDGKSINHRANFNINSYLELIQHAAQIITPYKYNLAGYSASGVKEKIVYAPWGFYEESIDPNIRLIENKNFYATFFGLAKGLRKDKLDFLMRKFPEKIICVDNRMPHLIRPYYLSNSRYALALAYGEIEHFVNPFRIFYLLANGIPVLSDSTEDQDGYLNFVQQLDIQAMPQALKTAPPSANSLLEKSRTQSLVANLSNIF